MTVTVDELVRDVIASVSTSAGAPAIVRWLNNRYKEMVTQVKFRHLRKVGELSVPATVSTGTITATKGSVTITPDADAQTAWLTSPGVGDLEHWFFRVNNVWYRIASVDALAATITLDNAFTETSVTDSDYELVKRYHSLASDARWIGEMYFDRLGYSLENLSLTELDISDPGRVVKAAPPQKSAQVGVDSSDYLMYELYPASSTVELFHYIYWSLPTALSFNSNLPSVIDSDTLKEGILIDVYRFEKVAHVQKGNVEAASIMANEEARQRTVWRKKIKDAIRTSRGSDDVTLILNMTRGKLGGFSREQRTAEDYVIDNWRR